MSGVWTKRAENIQKLYQEMQLKPMVEGSAEKQFYSAVWTLCEQLKDSEEKAETGQMVPPSLM